MDVDAVFGAVDVVGEVVSTQVFLQVVQPIQEIVGLPHEVFQRLQPNVSVNSNKKTSARKVISSFERAS